LENLARTTWTNIADGRRLGVGMGETTITDHNMLALRREHPSLIVHKHPAREEIHTGADWEWWLSTSGGWICLIFQAKLLDRDGRYPGITKGIAQGKPQIDALLRTCLARSEKLDGTVWPLYCFYNSWSGKWPGGVQRYDSSDPRIMSDLDLQLFGCAAADAWDVRRIVASRDYHNRLTLRDSYLPVSRPWSMIFPDPAEAKTYKPSQTLTALAAWRYRDALLEASPPPAPSGSAEDELLPQNRTSGSESAKTTRRDRGVIYRDPALINRPPDYVLELLATGRTRPNRRLKPIARRLVVLP
jgi:hypothetical protein